MTQEEIQAYLEQTEQLQSAPYSSGSKRYNPKKAYSDALYREALGSLRAHQAVQQPLIPVGLRFDSDSSYDEGITESDLQMGLDAYRDKQQSDLLAFGNTVAHGAVAAGEALLTTALITNPYGLAALAGATALQGIVNGVDNNEENDDPLSWFMDNAIFQTMDYVGKTAKEYTPAYTEDSQKQGMDKYLGLNGLDAFMEGAGFLAGGVGGARVAATKLGRGTKFYDSLMKLKGADKILKGKTIAEASEAGLLAADDLAKLNNAVQFADNVSGLTASAIGRIGESVIEARGTKDEMIQAGYTEEEADDAMNSNFLANMALALPDFYQNLKMFGTFKNILGSKPNIVGKYSDEAVDFYNAGKKQLGKIDKATSIIGALGKGVLEGAEEGVQYASNKAAQQAASSEKDFFSSFLDKFGESFTTEEGQLSWILGTILGSGATTLKSVKDFKTRNQELAKLTKEAEDLKIQDDAKYTVDENKYYKTIQKEDGSKIRVINKEYLNTINKNAELEAVKEYALGKKDETLYEAAKNKQILNKALFASQTGTYDSFLSEVESSKNITSKELQALKAANLKTPISEIQITDEDLMEHQKSVEKSVNLMKEFKSTYDNLQSIPALANLSKEALFKFGDTIATQKSVNSELQNVKNELAPYIVVDENGNETINLENVDPIGAEVLKTKFENYKEYDAANKLLLKQYADYLTNPSKLDAEVVKEKVKSKTETTKNAVATKIEAQDLIERINLTGDTIVNTPDGKTFETFLYDDGRIKLVNVKSRNEYYNNAEDFVKKYPEWSLSKDEKTESDEKRFRGVEKGISKPIIDEDTDDEIKYEYSKKKSIISTSGSNSLFDRVNNIPLFNDVNGSRENPNLKIQAPKKYAWFKFMQGRKYKDLSLRVRKATPEDVGQVIEADYANTLKTLDGNYIVEVYRDGKPVTSKLDGILLTPSTVIHLESYIDRVGDPTEAEEYKKLLMQIEERGEGFLKITGKSNGFVNVTENYVPVTETTLFKNNDIDLISDVKISWRRGNQAYVQADDNTEIPVQYAGRVYIQVPSTNGEYVYVGTQSQNISEAEADYIIDLLKMYFDGQKTITVGTQVFDILNYTKQSIIPSLVYTGISNVQNKSTEFRIIESKGAETIIIGESSIPAMSIEQYRDDIKQFLVKKKRHVNDIYLKKLRNGDNSRNFSLPVPDGKGGYKVENFKSYAEFVAKGSEFFTPAYLTNLATESDFAFLNPYFTFEPKLYENFVSGKEANASEINQKKKQLAEKKFEQEAPVSQNEGGLRALLKGTAKQTKPSSEAKEPTTETKPLGKPSLRALLKQEVPTAPVSDKKADIKKRRQEEFIKQGFVLSPESSATEGPYRIEIDKSGEAIISNEKYSPEGIGLKEWLAAQGITKVKENLAGWKRELAYIQFEVIDKINAKYDAELAALEGNPLATIETPTTVEEVEVQNNELAEEIKKFAEENNRDDLDEFAKEATEEPYKKGNLAEEIKYIESKLGVKPEVVKGLIRVAQFEKPLFGLFTNSSIILSDALEEGTGYHEAFHFVSQLYLTAEERQSLYDVIRQEKNTELTDRECEEILADEFRDFVLLDGKYQEKSFKQNVFQRLWSFIKDLLGLPVNTRKELFNRIHNGYYKSKGYINRLGSDSVILAKSSNIQFTQETEIDVLDSIQSLFSNYINNNNIKLYDLKTVANTLINFKKEVDAKFKDIPGYAYNQDSEYFFNSFQKYRLSSYGIDFLDSIEENDKKDRNTIEQIERYKFSAKNGASNEILIVTSNILDPRSKTSIGLSKPIPQSKVWNIITNITSDILGVNNMLDNLNIAYENNLELFKANPTNEKFRVNALVLKQLLASLPPIDSMDMNSQRFLSKFYDSFNLSEINLFINKIGTGRNDFTVIDSFEKQKMFKIRDKWINGFLNSKAITRNQGVVGLSAEGFNQIKSLEGLNFLDAIGIKVSTVDERVIKLIEKSVPSLKRAVAMVVNNGGVISDIFNAYEHYDSIFGNSAVGKGLYVEWTKMTDLLLRSELPYYVDTEEVQISNSEKETIYKFTKSSWRSMVQSKLRAGKALSTLAENSKFYEFVKEGKIKLNALIDGAQFKEEGVDGKHISSMTEGDLLLNRAISMFKKPEYSIVHILRGSDKKSEWAVYYNKESFNALCLNYKDDIEFINGKIYTKNNQFDNILDRFWRMYENTKNFNKEISNEIKMQMTPTQWWNKNLGFPENEKLTQVQFKLALTEKLEEQINGLIDLATNEGFYLKDIKKKNQSVLRSIDPELFLNEPYQANNNLLAALSVNELITNLEYANEVLGHPVFFGKDLFKRSAAPNANGRVPRTDDFINKFYEKERLNYIGKGMTKEQVDKLPLSGQYRAGVFEDVIDTNHPLYDEVNKADAQGMIEFHFYREYLDRIGQWSEEDEEAFQKEIAGEKHNHKFKPLKPVHYGANQKYVTDEGGEFVPTYLKFSVYPLLPSMIKGRKLEDINKKMLDNGLSVLTFKSGCKVGLPKKLNSLFDGDGNVDMSNESGILLNVEDLKIQVDINVKDKLETLFGTQLRKLIQQNVFDAGKPIDPKFEEEYKQYLDIIKELTDVQIESLVKELNINSKEDLINNTITKETWKKLVNIFIAEAKSRDYTNNSIVGIEMLAQEGITVDILPDRNKIQNLLNALINNRIVKQSSFGKSFVQASFVGFELKEEARQKAIKNGEIDPNSEYAKTGTLGFIKETKDGVQVAEILVPYYFKSKKGTTMKIDFNNPEHQELLKAVGYRIPTQGLNSMLAFKIVGFLPEAMGELAVVPYEITAQAGSDFDVDKLNLLLKNFMAEEEMEVTEMLGAKIKKPIKVEAQLTTTKLSKKQKLQNDLLDLMYSRLSDKMLLKDIQSANSAKELKKAAEKIKQYLPEEYRFDDSPEGINALSPFKVIPVSTIMWGVKAGVGQWASQSTLYSLMQKNPLTQIYGSETMKLPANVENGQIVLGKINNTDGKSIIDYIANQELSANVDGAKDPFILQLNGNLDTNDTRAYLYEAGVPQEFVNAFLTQPIIFDYIKGLNRNKSFVSKINKYISKKSARKNDLIKNLISQYNPNYESIYLNSENGRELTDSQIEKLEAIKEFSVENLKSFASKKENQPLMLDLFLFYNMFASDTRTIINGLRFDTLGAGKNLPETISILKNYDKALLNTTFSGVGKLSNDSIIDIFKVAALIVDNLYADSILVSKKKNVPLYNVLNSMMETLSTKRKLTPENAEKLFTWFSNYVLQNTVVKTNQEKFFSDMFKSENSLAFKVADIINNPKHPLNKNLLFSSLFTIDTAKTLNDVNTIKFLNKKIDRDLSNEIILAFKQIESWSLDNNSTLYSDILKAGLFQTGIVESPFSYYKYLPTDDVVEMLKDTVNEELSYTFETKNIIAANLYYNLKDLFTYIPKDVQIKNVGTNLYEIDMQGEFLVKTRIGFTELYIKQPDGLYKSFSLKATKKINNLLVNNDIFVDPSEENENDEALSAGEVNEVENQEPKYTPEFEAWYSKSGEIAPWESKEWNFDYYLKCVKK
jgi:hypothetical protein